MALYTKATGTTLALVGRSAQLSSRNTASGWLAALRLRILSFKGCMFVHAYFPPFRSIIYNNEADCISIDASFGIGGYCPRGNPVPVTTSSCYSAGQFAQCCCILNNCYNVAGYFSVWILAETPPSCLPGYYCPTPYGGVSPVSRHIFRG